MDILEVNGLCKQYPKFALKEVSFALSPGKITGFIGRNGAGKTTTLKALLNLVHPDAGDIRFFGESFAGSELSIKQRIGFVSGGMRYYPKKKISAITSVNKRFYPDWDDAEYEKYMRLFALDAYKTPSQLSEGMKVKYALTLALSHHAKLLILDEPTSGLDPVSRDELLDIFMDIAGEVTILFSTHITSDLDKCADDIIYIKNGHIIESGDIKEFLAGYRAYAGETLPEGVPFIGAKKAKNGYSAILRAQDAAGLDTAPADLETVMIHLEKEDIGND